MTTPKDTQPMCRPMFNIACAGEEGRHTYFDDWKPSDTDMLYLEVSTALGKWNCRCPRGAMNEVFAAIQKLGVTIEFEQLAYPPPEHLDPSRQSNS